MHSNARTNVYSRELMAIRVLQDGIKPRHVALSFGISERTVYKWLARYRDEGLGCLIISCSPHYTPVCRQDILTRGFPSNQLFAF